MSRLTPKAQVLWDALESEERKIQEAFDSLVEEWDKAQAALTTANTRLQTITMQKNAILRAELGK